MLQKWDSEEVEKRDFAYTLGDAYLPAQPAEQAQAAGEALVAIREWITALADP
jgi:hypothetical protein